MSIYANHLKGNSTPQSQPLPGERGKRQVQNSDGAYVFSITPMERVRRFLVLGTDGGTYYASERELTLRNAQVILDLIKDNKGVDVVHLIEDVNSTHRREDGTFEPAAVARKTASIFALAVCREHGDDVTRAAVYGALQRRRVVSTLRQLYDFLLELKALNSGKIPMGRGLRNAVSEFLQGSGEKWLAYQINKYPQGSRGNHSVSIADVVRLAHPTPKTDVFNRIMGYVVERNDQNKHLSEMLDNRHESTDQILARKEAMMTDSANTLIDLIYDFGLTWEMIPNHWFAESKGAARTDIMRALIGLDTKDRSVPEGAYSMNVTALIRQLARISAYGLIPKLGSSDVLDHVVSVVTDSDALVKARVHPLRMLLALMTYKSGRNRNLRWDINPHLSEALEDGFYKSFGSVTPTNKRIMYAVDISASMTWADLLGVKGFTPRIASALLTMVSARVEKHYLVKAFDNRFSDLDITGKTTINDAVRIMNSQRHGSTSCELPMVWARENDVPVDAFVVLTDSETNAMRSMHPIVALDEYRRASGIPAKLVVVGMTATNFTIADPNDSGTLDVVGFDATAPEVISQFILE